MLIEFRQALISYQDDHIVCAAAGARATRACHTRCAAAPADPRVGTGELTEWEMDDLGKTI